MNSYPMVPETRTYDRAAPRDVEPDDPRVLAALEEYVEALEAAQPPDREEFLERHAAIQPALRKAMEGLEFINEMGSHLIDREADTALSGEPILAGQPLGDFRILKQVGRGGMGVVYEATQLSLGRRVAVKVLPFATALDPRQLQRFKNEAQAAAHLHHQHIVPVYGVGCERGVHFYAMQFIDGQSLAAMIADLRRQRHPHSAEPPPTTSSADQRSPASGDTAPMAALSTERSPSRAAQFHTLARLGIQAAEALEHAHQMGVIHRDVKPANLLIDVHGKLWITDFGLAQFQSDNRLTLTGDILGTMRYMSPEAALAKRVPVDHRTDIYSLGTTLYELLTLEPVFEAEDRQELLRQIAFAEPKPLRRVNSAIPAELETIVLKAMEKNPAERYSTAQELADDLERFLKDEPIRARRPTLLGRTRKWVRRHRPVVTSAILAAVAVLATAITALLFSLGNISAALERERETNYLQRIALAERELAVGNVGRAEELLDECPLHLRGWEWQFLKRQRYGNPAPLQHQATVIGAQFSPDGRHIATAAMDGMLTVWNARTGQVVHRLEPPAQRRLIRGMDYSPDGNYLAVARHDGQIRVWNARSGSLLHTIAGHQGAVWQVAFSPDSQTLASGGADRSVRLWNVSDGRALGTFKDHPTAVKGVAFRPDGRSVIAACDDGTVKVWDRDTGRESFSFHGEVLAYPFSAWFSPDARRLAWSCLDGVVKVWDTTTGRLEIDQQSNTHQCRAVAFSPDGKRIALAGFDGTLRLLDAVTGRELLTLFAHNSLVANVAFSPDGNRLASASYDHTVRIWDATPLTSDPLAPHCVTLATHKDKVSAVDFSPDGRWLASASWDHTVQLWERSGDAASTIGSMEPMRLRDTLRGHRGIVMGLVFSSDSRTLASASWDNSVRLWDLPATEDGSPTERFLIPLERRASSIDFSPDGRLLAIGQDTGIDLFDPVTGKPAYPFKQTVAPVPSLAFTLDNRWLVSAGASDPALKIWAVANETPAFEIRHYSNPNGSVAVSWDGRRVASQGRDQAGGNHTVKVWEVDWEAKTYTEFRTLKGHAGYVWKVAFSPDGRYLASGSWDSTLKVWDLAAPESAEPVTLRGHAGFIQSLAFSPDGRRLASGSGYAGHGEVKIWDSALWESETNAR